jgi:glycine/D-amino acid oxidase-like deaminating enzyme
MNVGIVGGSIAGCTAAVELLRADHEVGGRARRRARWTVGARNRRSAGVAALGEQVERAFVWNAPDFSSMTESEARAWCRESISFPDDFRYVSTDGK